MTPRIAIPIPTSFDLVYNRANYSAYVDAVRLAGGEPVEVNLSLNDHELQELAQSCDGIALPGSPADVEPSLFGQEKDAATAAADVPRERTDRILLEDAYRTAKPVLGICFGTQMLNVFRGGTLVQDLVTMPVNHSAGRSVAVAHSATIAAGSLLGSSIDVAELEGADRLPINSSHHQAVGIPGEGLVVSARCPQDGVVEAIEGSGDHFVLGVQWHPERSFGLSSSSRSLFGRLVDEARKWRR
jgi:putative glutamine amidotransferase